MAGATTDLPEKLDPDAGIDLRYFAGQDGFARPMAPMQGEGVVWLSGLVVLPDESGRERMLAYFQRRRGLGAVLEEGFVAYNDDEGPVREAQGRPGRAGRSFPTGYPSRVRDATGPSTSTSRPRTRPCGCRADWKSLPRPRLLRGLHLPEARHPLRRQGQGPARARRRREARLGVEEGYAAAGPEGAAGAGRGRQDEARGVALPAPGRRRRQADPAATTARASGTTTARSTS